MIKKVSEIVPGDHIITHSLGEVEFTEEMGNGEIRIYAEDSRPIALSPKKQVRVKEQ